MIPTSRTNAVTSPPTTLMAPTNRIQRAMLRIVISSRTRKGIRDREFSFKVMPPIDHPEITPPGPTSPDSGSTAQSDLRVTQYLLARAHARRW